MAKQRKATQAPATQAPATQAPATQAPVTVALRGGLAVALVALTGKPYRVKADHNGQWWMAMAPVLAEGGNVQAIIKAGVPSHFVGYCIRRGYLAPVTAE